MRFLAKRLLVKLYLRLFDPYLGQADAISMGLGDALSEKAELNYVKREYARETWEMDTNPAGEVQTN